MLDFSVLIFRLYYSAKAFTIGRVNKYIDSLGITTKSVPPQRYHKYVLEAKDNII